MGLYLPIYGFSCCVSSPGDRFNADCDLEIQTCIHPGSIAANLLAALSADDPGVLSEWRDAMQLPV